MNPWENRHPSVKHFEKVLTPNPNLPEHLREISTEIFETAQVLLALCKDGPELSTALRKLREAKDCAVMQAVIDASLDR